MSHTLTKIIVEPRMSLKYDRILHFISFIWNIPWTILPAVSGEHINVDHVLLFRRLGGQGRTKQGTW